MAKAKEIQIQTNFGGSVANFESVKKQIAERWSKAEAERYNANSNCATYRQWQKSGYYVVPNQKALHSKVIIERKDKSGKIIARYPKKIALFYHLQVRPMES